MLVFLGLHLQISFNVIYFDIFFMRNILLQLSEMITSDIDCFKNPNITPLKHQSLHIILTFFDSTKSFPLLQLFRQNKSFKNFGRFRRFEHGFQNFSLHMSLHAFKNIWSNCQFLKHKLTAASIDLICNSFFRRT